MEVSSVDRLLNIVVNDWVMLSVSEAINAIVDVGNGMFGRKWKLHSESSETIDKDTMPEKKNIREKLNLIEAETLSFIVDAVRAGAEEGRMITAAIDSTTKKRAGQFATQGIHIGQNVPFPLPLMNICMLILALRYLLL